ncbi:MAG: putative capsular polysaccharide synthesis family protein [Phycisphaerales bacterium]|nr:hypothetical protein [Planctomycetota bacterium]MCH8508454.1 putative capsular polysaccharide synthesis family protein [Phycisphaerales bacterium]
MDERLASIFAETIEDIIARGENCPPGLDFDAPRPGVAPGNLWDAPSAWQDPRARGDIGDPPDRLDDHPCRTELLEAFVPADYLSMNPDLEGSVGIDHAREHFIERGYTERRPYSRRIWGCVEPRMYAKHTRGFMLGEDRLRQHYGYRGRFEDRIPNDLTAWVANTRVHLWQMGKVGSISIQRALRDCCQEYSTHLHYVDAWHHSQPTVGVHYSRLLRHHGVKPKLIVCGVRDPIDRVISGYFQEFESRPPDESRFSDIEGMTRLLACRFLNDLWITCGWFDHGFFCDLDVYATPFDHDAGFVRLESGPVRVFLYAQHRLAELEAELAAFLGVDELRLPRANISADKPYADTLAAIKRSVRLPRALLDRIYACRYARHFYPDGLGMHLERVMTTRA